MYRNRSASGFVLLTITGVSANASAALSGPVSIDFNTMLTSAIYGTANTEPLADGSCPASTCWYEDGITIGVVNDPNAFGEHLHRYGSGTFATTAKLQYHADSSGLYVRATDGSAFSLLKMQFLAAIDATYNPGYDATYNPFVAGDTWEILGFNSAINPDLSSGDGTNYATRVAYQTVDNGFSGTLSLASDFHNINAFWIHFKGYPGIPQDNVSFGMKVDNIELSTPVPVPSAVWMFVTGMMSLISIRRKKFATRSFA